MPKIYVPNKSIHDYSPAEVYGKLVFLSEGNFSCYRTSRAYRKFWPILKNSEPEDYLLVAGLPMLNIVAAYILTRLHGRLNLLLFKTDKNGDKKYLERVIIGGAFEKR